MAGATDDPRFRLQHPREIAEDTVNWRKEAIDQPLHALWSGLSTWAVASGSPLVFLGAISFAVLVLREIHQKADKPGGILDHWPWTDTVGYATGILVAVALLVAL